MPIQFPGTPSVGQIYTAGSKSWKWNGYAWDMQGGILATGTNPPLNPKVGDQWYKSDTDVLYEFINDGSSSNWIDISSSAFSGSTNPFGNIIVTTGKAIAMAVVFGG
jgi:hypothetical protein